MKIILMLTTILFTFQLQATVSDTFKKDKVILTIQETEADQLFDSMLVQPILNNYDIIKHIQYENLFSDLVFDLACLQSISSRQTTCRLKIFSTMAIVDSNNKYALLNIRDQISTPHSADTFAEMFSHQPVNENNQADIFVSENRKLRIWKTFNSQGKVVLFTVEYK